MARGRKPLPVERKRARGNPGKRPLPELSNVTVLAAAEEVPDPERPLGPAGRALWNRSWNAAKRWMSPETDYELLLITCELVDDRVALRVRLLQSGSRADRRDLRDIDRQILAQLSALGFTPADRSRLGVAEVVAASKLAELRSARARK